MNRTKQPAPARNNLARIAGVGLLTCTLAWSGAVSAHARLVRSKPVAEAELGTTPKAITLWFNEQPEADFSSVKVLDAAGKVAAEGALTRTKDSNALELAVPTPLAAGAYTVRYRVLSVDGHVIEDAFTFRVGSAAARP
jgi:methionine-rich copper-binding protein CopC